MLVQGQTQLCYLALRLGTQGPRPSRLLVVICDVKVLDQDLCVAALKHDFEVP